MSSLSFVQIMVQECILSTEDAIGFIRPHPRISEKVQRSALTEDGVKGIIDDRDAIERMACEGRIFKVRHLFLFAEPKARKRGGWRKDLLDFMGRVEDRGAIIKDVDLQLTTEKPSHRSAMVLQAIEQLANNGRTVHLKGKRSGRKPTAFTAEQLKEAKSIWRNVMDYPSWGSAVAAFPDGFTGARAYKLWGKRI
jgi:hypothetical protein